MEYDTLVKNVKHNYKNKLEWLLERCVLETTPCKEDDKYLDENGKELFNIFLNSSIFKKYIEIDNNYKLTCKCNNSSDDIEKNLENALYEFLSEIESDGFRNEYNINEKILNQSEWEKKENAEKFIEKLYSYRYIPDSNLSEQLVKLASNINNDSYRYIYELIQNADDCEYEDGIEKNMQIDIEDGKLTISYPEKGMTASDIIAITTIGQSNKLKKKKSHIIIGEKGKGFKTIFAACDNVQIYSNNFTFSLTSKKLSPEWIEDCEWKNKGTRLVLNLNNKTIEDTSKVYTNLIEKYGIVDDKIDPTLILKNCPIFFTNNIDNLKITHGNSSLSMKRLKDEDNSLKIKYTYKGKDLPSPVEEELDFYYLKKDVEFKYKEYISYYNKIFNSEQEYEKAYKNIKTYPIILIAPKKIQYSEEKKFESGNIFTYLPTYTNTKAPISIQIPYYLNEDRSCMWLVGPEPSHSSTTNDGKTIEWNSRLFQETFISGEGNTCLLELFYNKISKINDINITDYLPSYSSDNHDFFKAPDEKYAECIKLLNQFCKKEEENSIYQTVRKAKIFKMISTEEIYRSAEDTFILFDSFITKLIKDMNEENQKEILQYIEKANIVENEHISKCISEYIDLHEKLKALGIGKISVKNPVEFTNFLLKNNFEEVIKELSTMESNKKDINYLCPVGDDRKKLKLISSTTNEKLSWNERKIWIKPERDKCSNFNDFNYLGFYVEDINKYKFNEHNIEIIDLIFKKDEKRDNFFEYKTTEDLWGKIWNYLKNNDKHKACFSLIKEIFSFLAKNEKEMTWSNYILDILKDTDDNKKLKLYDDIIELWLNNYQAYRESCEDNKI